MFRKPDPSDEDALARGVWGERETSAFDHAVIENTMNAVIACDEYSNLVVFNPTAREWHGLDPAASHRRSGPPTMACICPTV
jgi:hypothetical protein